MRHITAYVLLILGEDSPSAADVEKVVKFHNIAAAGIKTLGSIGGTAKPGAVAVKIEAVMKKSLRRMCQHWWHVH